jgi:type 1 glutamine amidotransferase
VPKHGAPWAWYHRLLGADFLRHPRIQPTSLLLANPSDPLSRTLPQPWRRTDEWYDFHVAPESVAVLVRVDETTYRGGGMGMWHPVSWYHPFDGGRAWYTAMGHTTCSYSEEPFLDHHLAGIRYA